MGTGKGRSFDPVNEWRHVDLLVHCASVRLVYCGLPHTVYKPFLYSSYLHLDGDQTFCRCACCSRCRGRSKWSLVLCPTVSPSCARVAGYACSRGSYCARAWCLFLFRYISSFLLQSLKVYATKVYQTYVQLSCAVESRGKQHSRDLYILC